MKNHQTEVYGAPPGSETPTIPGSTPKAKGGRGRRQLRKRTPQPPKSSKKKHKVEEAGPGDEPDDDISEIECPACGKLVSLDEDACPFCGEVFEAETETKDKSMAEDYEVHLPGSEEEEFEAEFEETDDEDWEDLDADELEELDEIEEVDDELEELDELEDLEEESDEVDWETEE
jgi:ribonuclease E